MPTKNIPLPCTPKSELSKAWSDFFDELKEENILLTLTVVFKPVDRNNSCARWESEYKQRVLNRFRRAINRKRDDSKGLGLVFPDFYYFERNEASVFRKTGSRKPFHIHALLPIRKSELHRVWSIDNNCLKKRLSDDLYSLDTVQSIDVEQVREGKTLDWVRYITKYKQI
jgi:hypothetical protein